MIQGFEVRGRFWGLWPSGQPGSSSRSPASHFHSPCRHNSSLISYHDERRSGAHHRCFNLPGTSLGLNILELKRLNLILKRLHPKIPRCPACELTTARKRPKQSLTTISNSTISPTPRGKKTGHHTRKTTIYHHPIHHTRNQHSLYPSQQNPGEPPQESEPLQQQRKTSIE